LRFRVQDFRFKVQGSRFRGFGVEVFYGFRDEGLRV
jgi:hypothetical protein